MPTPRRTDTVNEDAKDAALVWLVRRAYQHGAWFHAKTNIEDALLAPEVKQALLDAVDRANL